MRALAVDTPSPHVAIVAFMNETATAAAKAGIAVLESGLGATQWALRFVAATRMLMAGRLFAAARAAWACGLLVPVFARGAMLAGMRGSARPFWRLAAPLRPPRNGAPDSRHAAHC